MEQRAAEGFSQANATQEVRTEPLPVGGNGGAYNSFWTEEGTAVVQTGRTSLISDPLNGQLPPLTAEAQAQRAGVAAFFRPNTGTAWWLTENGLDAPGPYDDPEIRPLAERCLLGFGSGCCQ